MTLTRRIKQFVKEVAKTAVSEEPSAVTYEECVAEYTDQIVSDDFRCVVWYADFKGIAIPRALRGALK